MAKKTEAEESKTASTELERYHELVAEKIAAGLPAETAAECAKRQLDRESETPPA